MNNTIIVRNLNLQPYEHVFLAMNEFTNYRNFKSRDEIWLVQHTKVFTQGHVGKKEHILMPGDIPVIQSNRGGQVTFHGPGQQVIYLMLNLRRRKISAKELVKLIEQSVLSTLFHFSISAFTRTNAPGVYVENSKICSIGIRVRNGFSFHGLALNVQMDLSPFLRINPCGYPGMKMTQISDLSSGANIEIVTPILVRKLITLLGNPPILYKSWKLSNYTTFS